MSLFTLFGIRFGWSSIIGLIPWLGDAIDLYFAYAVVQICQQVSSEHPTQMHNPPSRQSHTSPTPTSTGLPASITSKMYTNVAIDFALGLVPFLGDIADASFKCNTKNVALLEKYLVEKHAPKSMSQSERARSGLEVFPEDAGMVPGLEGGQHAQYGAVNSSGPTMGQQGQRKEQQEQRGGGVVRGWFGFGGGKAQGRSDVEQGGGQVQQETGTIPARR